MFCDQLSKDLGCQGLRYELLKLGLVGGIGSQRTTSILTPQSGNDPISFSYSVGIVHVLRAVLNTHPCRLSKFPSEQTTPHRLLTRMLEDVSLGQHEAESRLA
jgi:hypothetical protein